MSDMFGVDLKGDIFTFNTTNDVVSLSVDSKCKSQGNVDIHRKIRKRNNSLIKLLNSIDPPPDWVASVNYPPVAQFKRLTEDSIKLAKKILASFARSFKHSFKKGYIVWVFEHSDNSHLHCHMYIGTDSDIGKDELADWVREKWSKFSGNYLKNATNVCKCDPTGNDGIPLSYVTSEDKKKNLAKLIWAFGDQYHFGVVCRKHMNTHTSTLGSTRKNSVRKKILELIKLDIDIEVHEIVSRHDIDNAKKSIIINKKLRHLSRMMNNPSGFHIFKSKDVRDKLRALLDDLEHD